MRAASLATLILPALLAGAISFAPSDLDAQARGKGADKDARNRGSAELDLRPRPELQRRAGNGAGKVPPGWCIGRGNPHNTPENCGYRARRFDPQDRNPRAASSFEEAHTRFHRELDRRCRARAEQRPFDLDWQVRVRTECRAEHDRWHERNDPSWNRRR